MVNIPQTKFLKELWKTTKEKSSPKTCQLYKVAQLVSLIIYIKNYKKVDKLKKILFLMLSLLTYV